MAKLKHGDPVYFGAAGRLAFVRGDDGGDTADLVVINPDGVAYEDAVTYRERTDFDAEGAGRTFRLKP
jgi:hypothetical protein